VTLKNNIITQILLLIFLDYYSIKLPLFLILEGGGDTISFFLSISAT